VQSFGLERPVNPLERGSHEVEVHLADLGMLTGERLDRALVDVHAQALAVDRRVEAALVHVVLDHVDLEVRIGAFLPSVVAAEETIKLVDALQR